MFQELLLPNLEHLKFFSYSVDTKVMEHAVGILIGYVKSQPHQGISDHLTGLLVNHDKSVVRILMAWVYESMLKKEGSLKRVILHGIQVISQAVHSLQTGIDFDILDHSHILDNTFEALDKEGTL